MWGQIAAAGAGALGGALAGNEEHYGPGDYLPNGWGKNLLRPMGDTIANLQDRQAYGGQRVANLTPQQRAAIDQGQHFGLPGGVGNQMMWQGWNAGQTGLGAINRGMNYLDQVQGTPNNMQYGQGMFDQTMANLAPGVQGMFDANARGMQQDFDFNVLPGLNMQAGLAGGYGGTRADNQSALARAQNAGNIQSMGTQLWQNAANQAQSAAMRAATGNQQSADRLRGDVLRGYGQFGSQGANMMNQAYNMGVSNIDTGMGAGAAMQGQQQRQIDANMAAFNERQALPWQNAADRMDLISMGAIGTPQRTGMSGWEGALQGAQVGLGLYNAFNQPAAATPAYVPPPAPVPGFAPNTGPGSPSWGGYFADPSLY